MTICAAVDVNGFLILDGTSSPPNCALIVLDQNEYSNLQASIQAPVFVPLSLADGALIAGAILPVWAVGWAFRLLIRFLKEADDNAGFPS